jgi:hypothetical protein
VFFCRFDLQCTAESNDYGTVKLFRKRISHRVRLDKRFPDLIIATIISDAAKNIVKIISVGNSVTVEVGVGVNVCVGFEVGVSMGNNVEVGVDVGVGIGVEVKVGEGVGTIVIISVNVGVGAIIDVTMKLVETIIWPWVAVTV